MIKEPLPIQVENPINRTNIEAKRYLLPVLLESVAKQIEAMIILLIKSNRIINAYRIKELISPCDFIFKKSYIEI